MSNRPLLVPGLVLLASLIASTAMAQVAQQGPKLLGSGIAGLPSLGWSIALSADGGTLVTGGPNDGSVGAAWAFTRTGASWSQQGNKLVGSGAASGAEEGYAVALSADGSTLAVAGPYDNSNVGAIWIFTRNGGVWAQQGVKLVGSGAVGAAKQGFAVSLSADGNTMAAGGPFDNGSTGAVWVFVRNSGAWSQQGAKLVGTGGSGPGLQGYSVSLCADGNTLIEGSPTDGAGAGAAWAFTRSGGAWSQQGTKLVGSGATGPAQLGISAALSADGSTAAVGGNSDNNAAGAVWVFSNAGGAWNQQGAKITGSSELGSGWMGISTALSADGNTLMVGGERDNSYTGAAWVFTRAGGTWSQLGGKLTGTGAADLAELGSSVALSADGFTAVAGGAFDNSGMGAAWVYVRPAPVIVSVGDVQNDQGGKVSLRWTSSVLDFTPGNAIDAYGIWRQVPSGLAARMLSKDPTRAVGRGATAAPRAREIRARVLDGKIYYWEYLGSQVAHGFPGYSYTASTLSDSIAGSNPYTLFMVEAQQISAGLYWSSAPDSGYSVDNLPPAMPAPFVGLYTGSSMGLHWGRNTESDLGHYNLYRGSSADFVPGPGNLLVSKPDTGFVDPSPGRPYFYKLSAVDIHGNESHFALLTPSQAGAVATGKATFWLAQAVPSPMQNRCELRYSLAREGEASLTIYNAAGARIRTILSGWQPAGEGSVRWDGANASGSAAPAGLYFYRLSAGGRTLTGRVVSIR